MQLRFVLIIAQVNLFSPGIQLETLILTILSLSWSRFWSCWGSHMGWHGHPASHTLVQEVPGELRCVVSQSCSIGVEDGAPFLLLLLLEVLGLMLLIHSVLPCRLVGHLNRNNVDPISIVLQAVAILSNGVKLNMVVPLLFIAGLRSSVELDMLIPVLLTVGRLLFQYRSRRLIPGRGGDIPGWSRYIPGSWSGREADRSRASGSRAGVDVHRAGGGTLVLLGGRPLKAVTN